MSASIRTGRRSRRGIAAVALALALVGSIVLPAAAAVGATDDFETVGLWTTSSTGMCGPNPTDSTYSVEYSTAQSRSATHSVHERVAGGGTVGRDCVSTQAFLNVPVIAPSQVDVSFSYLVTAWTDLPGTTSPDGFAGRMDTLAQLVVTARAANGASLGSHRYVVACSEGQDSALCNAASGATYLLNGASVDVDGQFTPLGLGWRTLSVRPSDDLAVSWLDVRSLDFSLELHGVLLHSDDAQVYWDDFALRHESYEGLCSLTRAYSSRHLTAQWLCLTLQAADTMGDRGQDEVRALLLKKYILGVNLAGRAFSPTEAAALTDLARQLMP